MCAADLRFPVAHWFKEGLDSDEAVLAYFQRCHGWIQEALSGGNGVLIHCLAGAHRAGTTGVSWLMHAAEMDRATATAAAQQLRNVVNPFGHLVGILEKLEAAHQAQRSR
jgi:protein-tyrosine phosphatase